MSGLLRYGRRGPLSVKNCASFRMVKLTYTNQVKDYITSPKYDIIAWISAETVGLRTCPEVVFSVPSQWVFLEAETEIESDWLEKCFEPSAPQQQLLCLHVAICTWIGSLRPIPSKPC